MHYLKSKDLPDRKLNKLSPTNRGDIIISNLHKLALFYWDDFKKIKSNKTGRHDLINDEITEGYFNVDIIKISFSWKVSQRKMIAHWRKAWNWAKMQQVPFPKKNTPKT